MALKQGALWWRLTGAEPDRVAACAMMDALDRHHGMATGVFSGDECLAGTNPSQGTELCAVAEYLYSLQWLLGLQGDPALADRLERIAFNAVPATFSPDMWAHQYDQQVNQVECSVREERLWNTNGPDANIFGLEPHYGCCTANLSQAWPKFAAHLWMRPRGNGIAAVAYAPSALATEIDGVPVHVELRTGYPFREAPHFTVRAEHPVRFPLLLRIPGWAQAATVEVDGRRSAVGAAGEFHTVERTWSGATSLVLTLPMAARLVPRPGGTVALARGPLLYALRIGERWQRINADQPHRERPHADWEVYPTTPWNFASTLVTARRTTPFASPSTRSARRCCPPRHRRSPPRSPVSASPSGPPATARPTRRRRVPAATPLPRT